MVTSAIPAMKLSTLVWWCCCVQCAVTDILICSEYLVSGSYGVNDSALTASSVYGGQDADLDCSPRNARLFYPGDDLAKPFRRLGGWHSEVTDKNQFIQVTFPADTIVIAVTLQGRHQDDYDQWVSSYYLLYSMDDRKWTTVTSTNGDPTTFAGSQDRYTPVRSEVTPHVTARHLRVNPQSWYDTIVMRFDVSGCQIRKQKVGSQKFIRKPAVLTEEMMDSKSVVTTLSNVPSLKDCALSCYSHSTCVSYTYQTVDGIQRCTCYKTWVVKPGCYTADGSVFVNPDILDMYGYKEDQEAAMLYKIIEVRENQTEASTICTRQYTRLMRVDTTSKLTSLQDIINESYVLKQKFRYYVSGVYRSNVWRYSGGTDILESSLWSPSNPEPANGHCVMLTEEGLTSVDCQQNLFSICGT